MDKLMERIKGFSSAMSLVWYAVLIVAAILSAGEVIGMVKQQDKINTALAGIDAQLGLDNKVLAARIGALEIDSAVSKEKINAMYDWMRDDRKARGKSVVPNPSMDK
jgi:hypothetical protein